MVFPISEDPVENVCAEQCAHVLKLIVLRAAVGPNCSSLLTTGHNIAFLVVASTTSYINII
jgi:hypothetical protein